MHTHYETLESISQSNYFANDTGKAFSKFVDLLTKFYGKRCWVYFAQIVKTVCRGYTRHHPYIIHTHIEQQLRQC